MKKLLLLFLPCILWATHTDPIKKESTITKATVYISGARVERTASVKLTGGNTTFQFTGLSPFIDENSIQIKELGTSTIVSMKYEITYLFAKTDSEEITRLETDIQKKQKEIANLENLIKGLTEEETLLTANRKILENENTSLEKIKTISEYYRTRIAAINNAKYDHQVEKDSLQKLLNSYHNELSIVTTKNKEQKGVINLTLHSESAQQLNLLLTYTVANAGWFPVYDVKATSTKADLDIYFKAHVYQDSGEDWNNVSMVLSTADPSIKTDKPEIAPHYLNFVSGYNNSSSVANQSHKYNPFVKKVVGVVTDSSGLPLPGATVTVKGTNNSVTTDYDGRYSIEMLTGETLVVSYVGFTNKEIPAYASMININLQEDASQLEDVTVVGYGVAKALQGQVAGVNVTTGSGTPGSDTTIRIRGFGSVNGNAAPLYIVDGVPYVGDISAISPEEIENIEVLKDATATSIYGSRGANGVILITTKEVTETVNITTREYTIKKPQTIPSIMEVTILDIDQMTVKTSYEYIAVPVLNENVFLTATLQDWQQLNLLPGESNIYFSGTYVGKSYINPYLTKKDMVLSLGVAPNITVKRTLDNNFKSKTFMGTNRVVQRAYTIALQNTGKEAVTLKLLDRIPISQDKEIKVNDAIHDANSIDEEKGILTWEIPLAPGEHIEKHLSYELRYPKEKRINME